MVELETIKEWLEEEYNEYMSFYICNDEYIRMTDGSAGFTIEIKPLEDSIKVKGHRYENKVDTTCEQDKEELLSLLAGV